MATDITFALPSATGSALTTLGTKVSWCWESTAGTMPKSDYVIIYDCTKSPPLGGTPDKIETTPLIAKKFKTNVTGLQDLGDVTIECNWTQSVVEMHVDWLKFTPAARAAGKRLWICVDVNGQSTSYYIPVYPSDKVIEALEPNTAPKYVINLDVVGDLKEESDPTYANDEGTDTAKQWKADSEAGTGSISSAT